jgi:hypothetical protein
MGDKKKNKKKKKGNKPGISFDNDQLGENPVEGRLSRTLGSDRKT